MTYKISILTPVHISSGNKNACFLYHPDKNDHFNFYRIEDLLQFIPYLNKIRAGSVIMWYIYMINVNIKAKNKFNLLKRRQKQ